MIVKYNFRRFKSPSSTACKRRGLRAALRIMVANAPRVLSVQSHVVNGYVGQKCAILALNRLGFDVDAINTVSLSNHTGYRVVRGQRLGATDVKELWDGMHANGLTKQTHVLSGYIGDASIVEQLAAMVSSLPVGREYVADPVGIELDRRALSHPDSLTRASCVVRSPGVWRRR